MIFRGISWVKVDHLPYMSGLDYVMRSGLKSIVIFDNIKMEWIEWIEATHDIPFGEYVSHSDYIRRFTKIGELL